MPRRFSNTSICVETAFMPSASKTTGTDTGAPVYAGEAAMRTGSGLVYVGVPGEIYPIIAARCDFVISSICSFPASALRTVKIT